MINGLYFLILALLSGFGYFCGYMTGITIGRLRNRKEIRELDRKVNEILNEKWRCGECGEIRIGDMRVEAGMKCGHCAGYY